MSLRRVSRSSGRVVVGGENGSGGRGRVCCGGLKACICGEFRGVVGEVGSVSGR